MNERQTDILIIGAGFAGIAAAKKLHGLNRDFLVVEARDRIGGRTLTETFEGDITLDLGAKWLGPTQQLVWEWVHETNAVTYETYNTGRNILSYKGKISHYTGTIPKIGILSLLDLGNAINQLEKLAATIDTLQPWQHPKAERYDEMTLRTWIRQHTRTEAARHMLEIGIQTVFAAESSEISLLFALFYLRSGDNLETLISITNGAQQTILKEGTQGLLKKVAAPFADRIVLQSPVQKIVQDATGVTAHTAQGIIRARKCILTVPPALLERIRFEPPLPQQKAQLCQRMPMGAAMKCFAVYPVPFWRKHGLSGQVISDEFPVKVTFDVGQGDNDYGKMLVFVEGNDARNFISLPPDMRKQMVLETLVRFFGKEAAFPLFYTDKCWTEEEWTRGCYVGLMAPNTLTHFGPHLRTPFGNIHFAGTETADRWNGYLDGAIQSGYRAAEELMQV
ncbi:flavin monoamine oxidase family protein [Rhodoflexus caldus]|uniref:flavin monoamine oxidase family protein n=1 Tax=Rhodoflexus caldus TaxID=2891236 RepID=UPI00202A2A24|nr:FAD-dependent oxidoreductase [Rhodoflexus caldus]